MKKSRYKNDRVGAQKQKPNTVGPSFPSPLTPCQQATSDSHEDRNNSPRPPLDRKYVYTDFSHVQPEFGESYEAAPRTLPAKLNYMLSDPALSDVIAWQPHGRSWRILDRERFSTEVLPTYFEHSNYNSFVRLVNAWGFRRVPHGIDGDSHYHELFLRGMPHLHAKMKRTSLNERKAPIEPRDRCPNFASMPPLPPAGTTTSGENSGSSDTAISQSRLKIGDGSMSSASGSDSREIENGMRTMSSQNVAASISGMNSTPFMLSSPLPQNQISALQRMSVNEPSATATAAVLQLPAPPGQFPAMAPFGVANTNPKTQPLSVMMIGPSQQMTMSGLRLQQYQQMMAQLLLQEQHQRQQHQHQQSNVAIGYIHQSAHQQCPSLFLVPSSISIAPIQTTQNTFLSPSAFVGQPLPPLSGSIFTNPQATNANMMQSINVVSNSNSNNTSSNSISGSGVINITNNGFNLDILQEGQTQFLNQTPSLPSWFEAADPQGRGIILLGNLATRGIQAQVSQPSSGVTQQQHQQQRAHSFDEVDLGNSGSIIRR